MFCDVPGWYVRDLIQTHLGNIRRRADVVSEMNRLGIIKQTRIRQHRNEPDKAFSARKKHFHEMKKKQHYINLVDDAYEDVPPLVPRSAVRGKQEAVKQEASASVSSAASVGDRMNSGGSKRSVGSDGRDVVSRCYVVLMLHTVCCLTYVVLLLCTETN